MRVFQLAVQYREFRQSRRLACAICATVFLAVATLSAAEPPVTATVFAPGGETVIVGSQAGLVIYQWPRLEQLRVLETQLVSIHDLAFSPDGRILAAGGGSPSEEGQVELLSWPNGVSRGVLSGHEDSVTAVAWSDDDKLATASLDHTIAVWDLKTRKVVQRLNGHSKGVTTLSFLEDGTRLLSGSLDNNLRLWDLESGAVMRSFNNHTKEIQRLAIRPYVSGLPMAASISADRTVRLWQPTIGRMVRFIRLSSIPLDVAWSHDGLWMAVSCEGGMVRLLDPDTLAIVRELPAVGDWEYSLAVHPSDGSLIVGGRNGQIRRIVATTAGG